MNYGLLICAAIHFSTVIQPYFNIRQTVLILDWWMETLERTFNMFLGPNLKYYPIEGGVPKKKKQQQPNMGQTQKWDKNLGCRVLTLHVNWNNLLGLIQCPRQFGCIKWRKLRNNAHKPFKSQRAGFQSTISHTAAAFSFGVCVSKRATNLLSSLGRILRQTFQPRTSFSRGLIFRIRVFVSSLFCIVKFF